MERILYLVVPCYNEQDVLPETTKRLGQKLTSLIDQKRISPKSRVLYVDDGSRDQTWPMIAQLHSENSLFTGLKLSRNRGHQYALLAGLMQAKDLADVVISLDADLQDDVNAIDRFLDENDKGCDIVYGVRSSRATDTAFKRNTANWFYSVARALGVELIPNHADYRLMSKRALQALSEYSEANLFLRGIVPLIGFKYSTVEYERAKRFAGESKYPFRKMLALACNGVFSFSLAPIRLITTLGVLIFAVSIIALIYFLLVKAIGRTVAGWTTLACSIWMLGGIQLLSLGVMGEYIGKIYTETKKRPRYIVEKFLGD